MKSKGHPIGATGVGQVTEVFEQFTGKAGERTIKNAEIALTHNFGATGASEQFIFSKEWNKLVYVVTAKPAATTQLEGEVYNICK